MLIHGPKLTYRKRKQTKVAHADGQQDKHTLMCVRTNTQPIRWDCSAGHTLLWGPVWLSPLSTKQRSPRRLCGRQSRRRSWGGWYAHTPRPHPHTSHTPLLLSQPVHEGTRRETVPSPPPPSLFHPLPPPPPIALCN